MTIKYLLIKCNLTLLTASGARDIQSTTTMLVSLVYFLSTQSNVGKYLTFRIPPTLPPPPPLTKVDDNQFLLWGGGIHTKKQCQRCRKFSILFKQEDGSTKSNQRGQITKSRVIEIVSKPKCFPEISQTKGLRPFSQQVVGPLALLPLI